MNYKSMFADIDRSQKTNKYLEYMFAFFTKSMLQ